MNNTTKHTPRPSDVMAYFDLSDEQWDILPNSVVDRLTEIYMKETAAPAMYEALKLTYAYLAEMGCDCEEGQSCGDCIVCQCEAALAQAEGSKP